MRSLVILVTILSAAACGDNEDGKLVYSNPPSGTGKLRLVKVGQTKDDVTLALVVGKDPLTGYSAGFNLPVGHGLVRLAEFTPGKALAHAAGKPLIAINHLEGHALSPRLADPDLRFPYLLLLVSGGHCQLLLLRGVDDYRRLATTIDDAAGQAFDKTAKLLGLGYPGGPAVERLAADGDPHAVPLPRPLVGSAEPHFSFAGLKSAVARAVASGAHRTADVAASFQQAVVDCLIDRSRVELAACPEATAFVVAGGVAANGAIRAALTGLAAAFDKPFVAPPLWLCTDNGAMIAWAGVERFAAGLSDPLDTAARPRWPLDPAAEAVRGAGVKA